MGRVCDDGQQQCLLDFSTLLLKWNRVYNLTAISDPQQVISLHLLDSLTLLPYIQNQQAHNVIDIGTGAGLPGFPLAICCPDIDFMLLDSNAKKTRFIIQAASELGLKNIRVTTSRVEAYRPQARFDTVISRAVSTLSDLLDLSTHLGTTKARFLFMKGTYPTEELECLPDEVIVRSVDRVDVPGLDAQRHIVCLQS